MKEILDFIADLIEEEQQIYLSDEDKNKIDINLSLDLIVSNCQN